MFTIIPSLNMNTLTSSLNVSFMFPSVFVLPKFSSTVLHKRYLNGQLYAFPDFSDNIVCFPPFSMLLAIDLSYIAFIGLKDNSSSLASLWFDSKKGCWILLNGFLASIEILV